MSTSMMVLIGVGLVMVALRISAVRHDRRVKLAAWNALTPEQQALETHKALNPVTFWWVSL